MSNITYIWANSNRLQQEKVYLKTQSSGEDKTNILSAALWTFRRVGQAGFHRFSRGAFPKMVYTFIGKILLG